MRELLNSMVRFSAALATFALRQAQNMIAGPSVPLKSVEHMCDAMDSATKALADRIDERHKDAMDSVVMLGSAMVSTTTRAVHASPLTPRRIADATADTMKATSDRLKPLGFQAARIVIPPLARILCTPAGYGNIGSIESMNKILTIETVEFTHLFFGKDDTVAQLIDKILRDEPHRRLWLAEGLGQLFGNRALAREENPRNLLTVGEGAQIPEDLQLMAHAGICLSFARHHYDKIGKNATTTEITAAVRRIAELAQNNLLPGYAGIGYEAWGMVTQFYYRDIFLSVHRALQEIDPVHAPYLWHGAGRACYFINFMPGWNEPWPAFEVIRRISIDEVSRHNLLAGLAAGMMIVNMKTPMILESIIKERISRLSSKDAEAFAQGVACSMVMRLDTTPNEDSALRFIDHRPAPDVAVLWEKIAARPSRLAKDTLHHKLKAQRRLDDITCYRPLDELLAS